jgi:hypothetical protein
MSKKAKETKRLKAEPDPERLSDTRLSEELGKMKARLFGVQAMLQGVEYVCTSERAGVLQIMSDCAEKMEQIADQFEAERELRVANGRA